LRNIAIVGAGITNLEGGMMLERLNPRIIIYSNNKPREVRFRGYPENCIQISGIMLDVNHTELKIGDRSLEKLSELEGREIR
jgi:thioredoxin reductase